MSNNQKFKILFWLYNQKAKDDKSPLYIRIYVDQKKTEIATKHFIPKSYWDSKAGKCKSSYKHSQLLNAYIEKTRNDLNQIFLGFSSKVDTPYFNPFRCRKLRVKNKPKNTKFSQFPFKNKPWNNSQCV